MFRLLSNKYLVSIFYTSVCILFYLLELKYGYSLLKPIAFGLIFFKAVAFEKNLFLSSLLIFTLVFILCTKSNPNLNSSLGNNSDMLNPEMIRLIVFSCTLSFLNKKFCSSLLLCFLWLTSLACPIYLMTTGTFRNLLIEILTLSSLVLIFNKEQKSLFSYQCNLIITSLTSLLCFVIYCLDFNSFEISRPNLVASTCLLLVMLISALVSRKFSKDFINIFDHIELATTPDSSFLSLSLKPALKFREYNELETYLKEKTENITTLRRKTSQQKNTLDAVKKDFNDSSNKLKDLEIITDSISSGILVLNFEGVITYINRRFYEIFDIEITDASLMHYSTFLNQKTNSLELVILKALEYKEFNQLIDKKIKIDCKPYDNKILIFVDLIKEQKVDKEKETHPYFQ